jgi:hypothetical protein
MQVSVHAHMRVNAQACMHIALFFLGYAACPCFCQLTDNAKSLLFFCKAFGKALSLPLDPWLLLSHVAEKRCRSPPHASLPPIQVHYRGLHLLVWELNIPRPASATRTVAHSQFCVSRIVESQDLAKSSYQVLPASVSCCLSVLPVLVYASCFASENLTRLSPRFWKSSRSP